MHYYNYDVFSSAKHKVKFNYWGGRGLKNYIDFLFSLTFSCISFHRVQAVFRHTLCIYQCLGTWVSWDQRRSKQPIDCHKTP